MEDVYIVLIVFFSGVGGIFLLALVWKMVRKCTSKRNNLMKEEAIRPVGTRESGGNRTEIKDKKHQSSSSSDVNTGHTIIMMDVASSSSYAGGGGGCGGGGGGCGGGGCGGGGCGGGGGC